MVHSGRLRELTNTVANTKVCIGNLRILRRYVKVQGHIWTLRTISRRMAPFSFPWRISEATYVQKHDFESKQEMRCSLVLI